MYVIGCVGFGVGYGIVVVVDYVLFVYFCGVVVVGYGVVVGGGLCVYWCGDW